MAHLSHLYMTTGKTIALPIPTFVYKMISLLFNMLSKLVIALLPRSKCLNFMAGVTIHSDFGAQEKSVTVSIVSPSICHKMMGPDAVIFIYLNVLNQLFHSPLSPSSRGSLVPLLFLA